MSHNEPRQFSFARQGKFDSIKYEEYIMPDNKIDHALMTKEELRDYLRISDSTLTLLIKREGLPYIKLRRKVLFRRSDIDKFLENRTHSESPEKKKKKD